MPHAAEQSFAPSTVVCSVAAGCSAKASSVAAAIVNGDCSIPIEKWTAQNNAKAALASMNLPQMACSHATDVGPATNRGRDNNGPVLG
ncbi:MAG: hypothetical protein K2Q12_10465 [Rickettsiales bacterium]|nr:hypothetical protein [Rickettsiales bacterium]